MAETSEIRKIMTKPLPQILDEIEDSIGLADEAAKNAREAAVEARKAGEKAAKEAATEARKAGEKAIKEATVVLNESIIKNEESICQEGRHGAPTTEDAVFVGQHRGTRVAQTRSNRRST